MDSCSFDKLFKIKVPHILEKIFFSLDFESYKTCTEVTQTWEELLYSQSYMKMSKSVFHNELPTKEAKLFDAAVNGNANEVCKLLSSSMIDVNKSPYSPYIPDTPLQRATFCGHIEVVKLLLDAGADPNVTDRFGETLVYKASDGGHKNVLKLLLDRGGNPTKEDINLNTPLHKAALRGKNDVVQLLLERGAEVNEQNLRNRTPLHIATENGHQDVVQTLLEKGAMPISEGMSPGYPFSESDFDNRSFYRFAT